MWKCPKCRKEFRNVNQWHSCATVVVEKHFEGKGTNVLKTFRALMKKVEKIGPFSVNSTATSIHIKAGATFLGAKPMKNSLTIDFYLKKETKEFPVIKTLTVSKNRIVHLLSLDSPRDITPKVMQWIRESYSLVKKIS